MIERARTIRCFGKINLGLRVIGRREDGFHELRTILHTIDLHDTLEVRPARSLKLQVKYDWPEGFRGRVPENGTNLVLMAARRAGVERCGLTLTKRIPPGAGLGGGSSDAAAALIALDRAAGGGAPPGSLHRSAAALGSDVPFFLYGGAALALGRGEEVYPLPDGPELHVVLGLPPEPLSTPEVFREWDRLLTSTGNTYRVNDFAAWSHVRGDVMPSVANDLEEAAIRIRPSLKDLRNTLETSGARAVAMTGSGSVFYGLYPDSGSATEGARKVRDAGFSAVVVRGVRREERDRSLWPGEEAAPGGRP